MSDNVAIRLVLSSLLLAASSCSGDEAVPAQAPAPAPAAAEVAVPHDSAEGVSSELATGEIASESLVVAEEVPEEVAAAEPLAAPDADETSVSNSVAAAVAAARAAEEVRAVAAAQERAEAREEAERLRIEAAKEKAEAEAKAEAALERRRISTRVFRLSHASAEEVAEKLNVTWSGDFGAVWKISRMAIAFQESNSVMVTAPAAILDACEEVVKAIDVEPRQVYIEARFVELSNDVFHDVGIDWSMLNGMKGSASLGAGTQQVKVGSAVSDYNRVLPDGSTYKVAGSATRGMVHGLRDGEVSYFNGTLNFPEMYIVLSALEQAEDARIFSNPKIIVSSGKKATVDMTTKYPNVRIAAKRTTSSGGDSLDLDMQMAAIPGEDKMMFAKEAFFSWGISLDVTPRVGTNGLINVSIVPTISSQSGWVESGTASADADSGTISARYPVIEVQRLVTEFSMSSGATAVIGGLSRTVEEQVDNGIPLLRDIPWLGPRFFGSMGRKKQQKEIIVFVTVGLVDPNEIRKDAGLPKNAVLGRQYTKGQKLEPGDRPEKNLEGIGSLDLRSLEEQAHDPLPPPYSGPAQWIPFVNDKKQQKDNDK